MASATALEVWTGRFPAGWRGCKQCLEAAASEAGLLLGESDLGLFALKHKRDENTLAPSPFIRRKATQTFAAVNQLFDCDLHLGIVRFVPPKLGNLTM
jgi:hypothetical protein